MAHEDWHREDPVEGSSNRSFGVVFAVLFALIATWPLAAGGTPHLWAAAVAALFALLALLRPAWLAAPNRAWLRLGLLLGRVVSPLALGLLFYLVFAPLGLLMRLTGKDPLRRRREPGADSYWIAREPPGPPPQSMNRQF